jgi:uncharacterized membrane protein
MPKHSILSGIFSVFGRTRMASWYISATALVFLLFMLISDSCWPSRKGLVRSRRFGYVAIFLLYGSSLIVAAPDYLGAADLLDYLPHCAPRFNRMVVMVIGDMIGLGAAAYFTAAQVAIVITSPIIIIRACCFFIYSVRKTIRKTPEEERVYQIATKNATHLIRIVCVFTPCIIGFPLLFLNQLVGDEVFRIVVAIYVVLAFSAGCLVKIEWVNARIMSFYLCCTCIFFVTMGVLIWHVLQNVNMLHVLVHLVISPVFIPSIISEICISAVIVSDLVTDSILEYS